MKIAAANGFGPFMHEHGLFTGWLFVDTPWRFDGSQVLYMPVRLEVRIASQHAGSEAPEVVSVERMFRDREQIATWLLSLEQMVHAAFRLPTLVIEDRSAMRVLLALADQVNAIDLAQLYVGKSDAGHI